MTHEQYLKLFTRHLRVGEPKRGELVAELRHHLDELPQGANAIEALGYPIDLAGKYNRTHIGLLGSKVNLLILPWVICGFVLLQMVTSLSSNGWQSAGDSAVGLGFWMLGSNLLLIVFFLAAVWAGISIRRMQHPGMALGGLVISSLIAPIVLLTLAIYLQWRHDPTTGYFGAFLGDEGFDSAARPFDFWYNLKNSFGISVITNIFALGTAFMAAWLSKPLQTKTSFQQKTSLFTEVAGGIFATFVVWYLVAMVFGVFATPFVTGIALDQDLTGIQAVAHWIANQNGAYILSAGISVPWVIWKMGQRIVKKHTATTLNHSVTS